MKTVLAGGTEPPKIGALKVIFGYLDAALVVWMAFVHHRHVSYIADANFFRLPCLVYRRFLASYITDTRFVYRRCSISYFTDVGSG